MHGSLLWQGEGEAILRRNWHMRSPKSGSDRFVKDGRTICVGDCALFKPPQGSPPFIGIIRGLIYDKENNLHLHVNWLYRQADLKLGKDILLDYAPNEIFYSFHKDKVPAASLLHPCKVAFLPKGVALPSRTFTFVCRRVYDTESNLLWWLSEQDYINELQEEVDQLLYKTRIEMHKPINGPTSTSQLRHVSDSTQNHSHGKGKKRERGIQHNDPVKRESSVKMDDCNSRPPRTQSNLRSQISKITEKGGLVDFEGVDKFVHLMQPDKVEKNMDLGCCSMLAGVIAATDKFDCLNRFVQLRGLLVLDEWIQNIHKGKTGSGSNLEEFLLVLLGALEKLPVNLNALQMCNIGKSVNLLSKHKNFEIQKKAKSLVDTWKKRVEAEFNIMDAKSGSNQSVTWSSKSKSRLPEASHGGNRVLVNKPSPGEATQSASSSSGPAKNESSPSSVKDGQPKTIKGATKDNRSSSSSQSHNYGQSSGSRRRKASSVKKSSLQRISASEKTDSGLSTQKSFDPPALEGNIHKLIVKIPNVGRSPVGAPSHQEPVSCARPFEDETRNGADVKKEAEVSEGSSELKPETSPHIGSTCSPFRSMSALIESCVKYSEANTPLSIGDDVGMNLLASVATGEITKSDLGSPQRNSSAEADDARSKPSSGNGEQELDDTKKLVSKTWPEAIFAPPGFDRATKPSSSCENKLSPVSSSRCSLNEDTKTSNSGCHNNFEDPSKVPDGGEHDVDTKDIGKPGDENKVNTECYVEVRDMTEASSSSGVPDPNSKMHFDLNEGFILDDGRCGEQTPISSSPVCSSNIQITVAAAAAAAKGPFVPPEDLLRSKGVVVGRKGSAATSAFRPAEPRKILSGPSGSASISSGRAPLDFDLNVPDGGILEEQGGFDLDLNTIDVGICSASSSRGLEPVSMAAVKPMTTVDFDLNFGPGADEQSSSYQQARGEIGNYSWFPPGNFPTDRPQHSIIPSGGPPRLLGPAGTSFTSDVFRGSVLSSSPAVSFQPNPFQYPVGPTPTFTLPAASSSFIDPSDGGRFFPPPSFIDPSIGGRFYSHPDGNSFSGAESRWRKQGLDLNAGVGSMDVQGSNRISLAEEQPTIYHQVGGGGGLKRKDFDRAKRPS